MNRNFLLAAIFISLSNPGFSQSVKEPSPKRQEPHTTPNRIQNIRNSPIRVTLVESPDQAEIRRAREKSSIEQEQDEKKSQYLNYRLAILGVILSFLSIVTVVITLFYTARSANAGRQSADLAQDALSQTIKAVEAAVRSADAAEAATAVSREQFELSTRPYLVLTPAFTLALNCSIEHPITNKVFYGNMVAISGSMQNIGQSPANNVSLYVDEIITKSDTPPVWPEIDWDGHYGTPVPPNLKTMSTSVPIHPDDINRSFRGEANIFFRIVAKYTIRSGDIAVSQSIWNLQIGRSFADIVRDRGGGHTFIAVEGSYMT